MQFRRVIDYLEGICIPHNDPGIAQNLEITEQKSELTITNLNIHICSVCMQLETLTINVVVSTCKIFHMYFALCGYKNAGHSGM